MILHVAVFTWQEHVTGEQIADVTRALHALPAVIPELVRYDAGPDLGLTEGNADYAVAALVADEAGLRAYIEHPDHQAALTLLRRMIATRSAVQLGVPA